MRMFEFMCGELSEVRSRGTSAYTIGGDVNVLYTSTSRTLHGRKRVSADQSDSRPKSSGSSVRVNQTDMYWLPYSYGNPVVNIAANVLLNAFANAGLAPEPELPQ
jgi:hypothetical protein